MKGTENTGAPMTPLTDTTFLRCYYRVITVIMSAAV